MLVLVAGGLEDSSCRVLSTLGAFSLAGRSNARLTLRHPRPCTFLHLQFEGDQYGCVEFVSTVQAVPRTSTLPVRGASIGNSAQRQGLESFSLNLNLIYDDLPDGLQTHILS